MMYAYIDGDDIGLKIENSFMNNDEMRLSKINNSVKDIVDEITLRLSQDGYEIIFGGADGIICKKEGIDTEKLIKLIRDISKEITFSLGIGRSLRDSYIALRYAKSNGKDIAANYIEERFSLIK
ncbi:hypothetical protein EV581_1197 [Bacillus sp. BK006]|nr:hypothetical protein EV581_1197 [Bacillus sp. BK006]